MVTDFRDRVRADLQRSIQQMQDATGAGAASDWSDYRYRVGIVAGLRRALDSLEEAYRKHMSEDDE